MPWKGAILVVYEKDRGKVLGFVVQGSDVSGTEDKRVSCRHAVGGWGSRCRGEKPGHQGGGWWCAWTRVTPRFNAPWQLYVPYIFVLKYPHFVHRVYSRSLHDPQNKQTARAGVTVRLWILIQEVLCSNLVCDTHFTEWCVLLVLSVPPMKFWDST
jgi:hypothetical protein